MKKTTQRKNIYFNNFEWNEGENGPRSKEISQMLYAMTFYNPQKNKKKVKNNEIKFRISGQVSQYNYLLSL